jgi:hypothetical protein
MKIEITFRETDARSITYYLQKRYNSKASLDKLAKLAIRNEVVAQAKIELAELNKEDENAH